MAASRLLVQETPHVHLLSVGARFLDLSKEEKLYAHFLSRAAWYGARIILHQTSPESNSIFDLIIRLYAHSQGDWRRLAQSNGILPEELDAFLDYAATFLSNVGNYYVDKPSSRE
ncbi:hypothetical protein MMC10_003215 [Thelotrema lepadinum]|nr:hypothetical protein [Thelotrema lepadinum]